MIPPVFDESDLPERLRRLIAIEIDRIVEDLEIRRAFLVDVWSRHRDRGPLLDTVFSRWRTLGMTDLALIESDTIVVCEAFYRELDDLRMYLQFTQDMPTTLDERLQKALVRIHGYGTLAIAALGGAPERPVVEFVEEPPPTPSPPLSLVASDDEPPAEPDVDADADA